MLKKIFRIFTIFIICALLGAGVIIGYRYWQVGKLAQLPFIPQPVTFTLKAPERSLTATLTTISGMITKSPRGSTESAAIYNSTTIIQGDGITSDATSSALINFENGTQILVGKKANLQFINTIPEEMLLWQQDGFAKYQATPSAAPITVRSLSLLTTISSGSATIQVNEPRGNIITITTNDSPITVAYQDKDSNTHIINIPTNSTATYNHIRRTLTIHP